MIKMLDLCDDAGITYRKLDYWIRCGYVRPDAAFTGSGGNEVDPVAASATVGKARDPHRPGSGTVRFLADTEADVVKRIALLTRLGIVPACAARIARSWAEHPTWPIYLGEGVSLRVDDWHPEHPQHPDFVAAYRAAHAGQQS